MNLYEVYIDFLSRILILKEYFLFDFILRHIYCVDIGAHKSFLSNNFLLYCRTIWMRQNKGIIFTSFTVHWIGSITVIIEIRWCCLSLRPFALIWTFQQFEYILLAQECGDWVGLNQRLGLDAKFKYLIWASIN